MTTIEIPVKIKSSRKYGPDGNFLSLAARIQAKRPVITFRSAQTLYTTVKTIIPQPPGTAYWGSDYVRTGDLKKKVVMLKDGSDYTVEVLGRAAVFVNYGTRHMPAQPFFQQALAHVKKDVLPGLVKTWLKS